MPARMACTSSARSFSSWSGMLEKYVTWGNCTKSVSSYQYAASVRLLSRPIHGITGNGKSCFAAWGNPPSTESARRCHQFMSVCTSEWSIKWCIHRRSGTSRGTVIVYSSSKRSIIASHGQKTQAWNLAKSAYPSALVESDPRILRLRNTNSSGYGRPVSLRSCSTKSQVISTRATPLIRAHCPIRVTMTRGLPSGVGTGA
mmetsp:Transcript_66204/g.186424  ORF Transcript_66204/g.186424 Transcript_66204/m.186424 type:complete len:201 (-) Transcript_66204:332-934(-)